MFSSMRPGPVSDSPRSGASVAEIDELVEAPDRASARTHVNLVSSAPGAAILVWGPEAVCLAYNRHYRALAGLRLNTLGKPLFKVHPELERTWRAKLDLCFSGVGVAIDGSAFGGGGPDGYSGDHEVGWLLPATGADGGVKGAIALFRDVKATLEPLRRLVGAVGHDLRDPLVGIRVVSERLERAPKLTRERCAEDMQRVLELTAQVEKLADDMTFYAKLVGASGLLKVAPRPADLGKIVKAACAELAPGRLPPIRVKVVEAPGSWDEDAIRRVIGALVGSAVRTGPESGGIWVEVTAGRGEAIVSVRDEGQPIRDDDADHLFEPWKHGCGPATERRRAGAGLSLFLARELVHAHGGKIACDRAPQGGFVVRVTLPASPPAGSHSGGSHSGGPPSSGSGSYRAVTPRG